MLLLGGCLDVADDRARHEEEVGLAVSGGARVAVSGGLAAVRAFDDAALTVWAQAPGLEVRWTVPTAGVRMLTVRNAMPGLVLTGAPATSLDEARPTRRSWRVQLPAGETVLRLEVPDADDRAPWRFVVFADVQDRIDGVQDLFGRMAQEPDVRFGLVSGDLTEDGEAVQLERFQWEMETLPFPLFATLGNHELGQGSTAPPFHALVGRGNLSFDWRGVRFTLLDAASATIAPRVYDRLDGWLDAGRDGLHLVLQHIPPLDPAGFRNGAFASRAEALKLLSLLQRANVDLTIYGHVHSYYAFTNAGIEAHITGGGGAIPERFDGIGRHFLSILAEPARQRLRTSVVRVTPDE